MLPAMLSAWLELALAAAFFPVWALAVLILRGITYPLRGTRYDPADALVIIGAVLAVAVVWVAWSLP